jgi:hypothetical protein
MLNQDLHKALRRQALHRTLNNTLAMTRQHDHDVNPFRNLLPTFTFRNNADRLEVAFLSSHQPPSFSNLNPLPLSIPRSASSLQGVTGLAAVLPGSAKYGSRSAAWKDSDNFLLAAVQSLLTLQQQDHQQHKEAYLPFLQSAMQPLQTVIPQVVAPLTANTNTVHTSTRSMLYYQVDKPTDSTEVFKVLGSSLRGKTDPYIDISELPVTAGHERHPIRGGVAEPFPQRLYFMLQDLEKKQGKSHIISFYPHGRAFAIHDMETFMDKILPKYFAKQGKLDSFVRQINLYGFARIHSGPDAGGYCHELFLKGRPDLFAYMQRPGASKGKNDRRKCKDRLLPVLQPDFYAMKPIHLGQPPPTLYG